MLRMVAFDMDGTVGDTLALCIRAFREAAEGVLHREVIDEEVRDTFGLNDEGMIRQMVGQQWRQALNDLYVRYIRLHDMCPRPFEGMVELLDELRSHGLLTALVTGKGMVTCAVTVDRFGLGDRFDAIETGSAQANFKHLSLSRLLHKFALQPDEMIYVGDTASDFESCRKAGVGCLSALWSHEAEQERLLRLNPQGVVFSIDELRRRLLALCTR